MEEEKRRKGGRERALVVPLYTLCTHTYIYTIFKLSQALVVMSILGLLAAALHCNKSWPAANEYS